MDDFLTWAFRLLRDQRGSFGDDDSADDTSGDDDKSQADADVDDDKDDFDDDDFTIDLDDKDDEDDKDKKKTEDDKSKDSELTEQVKTLKDDVGKLREDKSNLQTALHQARQEKKTPELDKDAKPLSDAQLTKLLEDAETEGDTSVKLNILKYLSQQIGKGEADKAVNTAEMSRNADGFRKDLEEKFPEIANPSSDMRADLEQVKAELNIADHPYGDMFAVGFKLFQDMDMLIEAAVESGKDEALKGTADEKRKREIKEKALPSSKKTPYKKTYGLSASALETAVQMNLTQDQLPAYKQLVGKKPRTVSVEG